MKPWIAFLILCPLAAQDTTTPAPTTAAAPPSPVAAAPEKTISGMIDVGYQWRSGVGGSLVTSRTVDPVSD
jgi:hypothetical protein